MAWGMGHVIIRDVVDKLYKDLFDVSHFAQIL